MDLSDICKKVVETTQIATSFIRQEAQNFDWEKVEIKGMNDLVSYVDREAEQRVLEGLAEILPDVGFITEENPSFKEKTDKEFHWIIDPLDGTTNFLHGLPIFATSIGLMQGNEMILGVVHEVNKDECFYAWKGGGAYCNNKRIYVSPLKNLSESLLATGFPYRDFDKVPSYLDIVKDFMQKSHGLRRMGSAAVDLAYVACGRFQGFFEYNLNPWDVAGGSLIIQEAGGKVSTFDGSNDYVFGNEILAGGHIHAQMLAVIVKHWGK
jgi:myo-inositol-1(or 4)-monophosphatase